jgi:hypothetical protein
VGPEAFAQYRLAEKLEKGEFVGGEFMAYLYSSHGQPEIENWHFSADVDILYMFDAETGELALTSANGKIRRRRQNRRRRRCRFRRWTRTR